MIDFIVVIIAIAIDAIMSKRQDKSGETEESRRRRINNYIENPMTAWRDNKLNLREVEQLQKDVAEEEFYEKFHRGEITYDNFESEFDKWGKGKLGTYLYLINELENRARN